MRGLLLLISSFLLASCAALPAIRPVGDQTVACPFPFLTKKARYIHAIEASAAGETKAVMIGVTLADPVLRTLSCAIMSPEGMVLFEALLGPSGVKVSRALAPFNTPDFARNMMADIELIFFAPPGTLAKKGVLTGGDQVCRWHNKQGGWVDVSQGHDGRIQIRRYSEGGPLKRSVRFVGNAANPYFAIELQASELVDYKLVMTLIESEAAEDEAPLKEKVRGVHP